MRSWIHLDAEALRHNYRALKNQAAPAAFVPVIKSNGYGHGLEQVYAILKSEKPEWFAVNYVTEAKTLRRLGYGGRLLVVGPTAPRELEEAAALRLEIILGDAALYTAWRQLARRPAVHIKFDTGMSRQGFFVGDAPRLAEELAPYKGEVQGICSHFANVEDVLEHDYALLQMKRFQEAADPFKVKGFKLLRHIASSASTLLLKESLFDLARVGISLYGVWPAPKTRLSFLQVNPKLLELKPVLEWKTEIASVKPVAGGDYIGYGCTFRAIHDMKVAVLPVGYYEGFPRIAGHSHSYVLIQGKRCPVVGRICMNMMMVDVSHLPGVQSGESVTLIGRSGDETLDAATVAEWAQTIHYELFARLCPDIPRLLREVAP